MLPIRILIRIVNGLLEDVTVHDTVVTGKAALGDGDPGSPSEFSGHVFLYMKNRPLTPKGYLHRGG